MYIKTADFSGLVHVVRLLILAMTAIGALSIGSIANAVEASNEQAQPTDNGEEAVDEPEVPIKIHPLQVRPGLDGAIVLGIGIPALALEAITPTLGRTLPGPVPIANLPYGDDVVLGNYNLKAMGVSDVLLWSSMGAPFLIHLAEDIVWAVKQKNGHLGAIRAGSDALILLQVLAVNFLVTGVMKSAIGRHRPLAYLEPDDFSGTEQEKLIDDQVDTPVIERNSVPHA